MAETKGKLRVGAEYVLFWCPGCNEPHRIRVTGVGAWGWNGSTHAPTFSPSVLVRSGHYAPGWIGPRCWCTWEKEHPDQPSGFKCGCCHSFVTDGRIRFLSDCTHELAGQTRELPEYPDA